jgi:hypothetical protein
VQKKDFRKIFGGIFVLLMDFFKGKRANKKLGKFKKNIDIAFHTSSDTVVYESRSVVKFVEVTPSELQSRSP